MPGLSEIAAKHFLAFGFLVGISTLCAAPLTLVDINFDELLAGHTPPLLGKSMPLSLPSEQLIGIRFGSVVGANDVPGMENPVAQLRASAVTANFGYSQPVVYQASNIPSTAKRYFFTLDFFLSGFQKRTGASRSADEFSILFDLIRVQRIDFTTDGLSGRVSIGSGIPTYVGSFEFDRSHNLAVFLDLDRGVWSAWLDSQLLFDDMAFSSPPGVLSSIRVNLGDDVQLANVPVAWIDNLRLVAFPESPIVLYLPDDTKVECGTPHTLSVLVGHGKGRALNLVWSLAGTPMATNALPAGAPLNLMRVEFAVDLPLGQNRVRVTATDTDGAAMSAETTATVVDNQPPTMTSSTASRTVLWPPNGQMVPVTINALVEDTCSAAAWGVVAAYSNEPEFDLADIQIVSDRVIRLRARRSGKLGERIYTILLQAGDTAGNLSEVKSVQVTVAHHARGR